MGDNFLSEDELRVLRPEEVINSLVETDAEIEHSPPLKSVKNTGVSGFTSLMNSLLKSVMPDVTFTSAWPQGSEVKESMPAITYKIISRRPAKNIKPWLREELHDLENFGQHVDIYGQVFDVLMEFTIWSDRSYEADGIGCTRDPNSCPLLNDKPIGGLCSTEYKPEICPYSIDGLMERFERFMIEYSGYFMSHSGVQHLHFVEQLEDNKDNSNNSPLMKRTLQYFMKIERIMVFKTSDLEDVTISLDIANQKEE